MFQIVKSKFTVWVLIAVVLALLPLFLKSDFILNYLFLIFVYIVLIQSFNIIAGYTGQILLGMSAFFGMGALVTRLVWTSGVPIVAALIIGGLSTVVLACVIGLPTLRLKSFYFVMGALALAIVSKDIVSNILPGVSFLPGKYLATYSLESRYYLALVVAALAILAVYLLVNSRLGLALIAIREDEDSAAAAGINTYKYKVISLFISTFMAGIAGGLFAYYSASNYYYSPFNLSWAFEPMLITFIGGAGTILGPTIAVVGYIVLKGVFAATMGEMSILVFGTLFILVVLFLPGGLVEISGKVRRLTTRWHRARA